MIETLGDIWKTIETSACKIAKVEVAGFESRFPLH